METCKLRKNLESAPTALAAVGHANDEPACAESSPLVLVLAPQPFYEDRGTPIATRQLLTALNELGYRADLLTFPGGRSPVLSGVRYIRAADPLNIKAVPIGFSFRKLWLDLFLLAALRRQLRQRQYVCIHALEEGAFLAVLAARRHGIPVIYDMQSSMAEQMAKVVLLGNKPARALLTACERWLIRRADKIVTSAGLAERVRRLVPGADVREWEYSSRAPEVAPHEVAQLRTELQIEPDAPVVVYTGNFEGYQGLPLLIESMPAVLRRVSRTVFVLVGAHDSHLASTLRQLNGRVPDGAYRLVGRQPRELIPRYLALADVLVSPRVYGGNLPIKILEYLAAGRPIVATSIPAHRALLTDDLALLTEPSPEALARSITTLLTEPKKAEELALVAREHAERNLSWIAFVQSVAELYKGVKPND